MSNLKKKINIKNKSLGIFVKNRHHINAIRFYFYIPSNWDLIIIKQNSNKYIDKYFIYSDIYYYIFANILNSKKTIYDKNSKILYFFFVYNNNFYKSYWNILKFLFLSFSVFFFRRIKFKGKGYYLYKNERNTIALKFGFFHKIRTYNSFLYIKIMSKTSILFYGINRENIIIAGTKLIKKKPYNIFTGRGLRFSKQIIYKKSGKVSLYR